MSGRRCLEYATAGGRKRCIRREENVDYVAAKELELFIENDGDLYRQQFKPIVRNLEKKRKKGIYDKEKAVKLWMYLAESGAKKYVKEVGSGSWYEMFDVPTRRETARRLNDAYLVESDLGNYRDI